MMALTMHDAGDIDPVDYDSELLADFPRFDNELVRQAAQESSMRTLLWVLDATAGRDAIVTRILALRYAFRIEDRPMKVLAKRYRLTAAAISKQVVAICDRFGLAPLASSTARQAYGRGQKAAWRRRKQKSAGQSDGAVTND